MKIKLFLNDITLESGLELGFQIQGSEKATDTQDRGSTFYVSHNLYLGANGMAHQVNAPAVNPKTRAHMVEGEN